MVLGIFHQELKDFCKAFRSTKQWDMEFCLYFLCIAFA